MTDTPDRGAMPADTAAIEAPPPERRKTWVRIALIVIVVAIVATGVWVARTPARPLVQGMVDADEIDVSAKIAGRVDRMLVEVGDRVKPGQLLYTITSPEIDAQQAQARAALDAARDVHDKAVAGARPQQIQAARAQLASATAQASLAGRTATRLQNLYGEGVVSEQKRDEAVAQHRSATQAVAAAQAQLNELLAGTRVEDVRASGAQVRQAQGSLAQVDATAGETRVAAPRAAQVSHKIAQLGEVLPPGYPAYTLIDIDHPWVTFFLREDQMPGIREGREVRGDVPALKLKSVAFRIYFINPAGDFATWRATRQSSGYDVKSFEVRARPVQPVDGLRPGMSVLFGDLG